ncbi:MAG: phosphoglycerate dehydrogenase [Magnetococcus sp. WYHC-3]
MAKVLISDKMSSRAAEIFRERGITVDVKTGLPAEELKAIIGEYDGIAIRSSTKLTPELIEAGVNLKVIGRAGIGVDNVHLPTASKRGIIVMNTPFGNTVTTAEHSVAMIMAAARHLGAATASTRAGKWEKNRFMGKELAGKTLGIIGTGNIGSLVVERCLGLKMRVLAYDPFISRKRADDLGIELAASLEAFWPRVDVLTVHAPLSEQTRHLVDSRAFEQMKDGVIVVNCARGGIIDEGALVTALRSGKVFSAALDVFEHEPVKSHPLFEMENVVLTPHLGASTHEAQFNVAVQVAQQIADYLIKGTVQNALNIPSVSEKELPELRPWLNLGDRLGTTLGQLTEAGVRRLEIDFQGDVGRLNRKPIANAILNGLLRPMLDCGVNSVNAPLIAEERGIEVVETTRGASREGFNSLIGVTIVTEKRQRHISGTLFAGQPRIVAMNDVPIEANPEGTLLFIANQDTPGLIGRVGTLLGQNGINIANFHLGRREQGGAAIAFVNVDQPIVPELLAELARIPNVLEVKVVSY